MTLPLAMATPSAAAQAYARADASIPDDGASASAPGSFGAMLERAASNVVSLGDAADMQAMKAVGGNADVTDVVTAVSKAELALQTTVTIRDRVIQAYQDIMKMPI